MDKSELEIFIKKIKFDPYYIEATFQFHLLMELAFTYKDHLNKIFPERSIKYYKLSKLTKERIDIVLEINNNIAIELKMPMNGQVPEQMFKFIQDMKFLEELKSSNKFSKCFLLTVTNNSNFWSGREQDGIYSYFRGNEKINGIIHKPTGQNTNEIFYEINGEYKIQWNNLNDYFKYFIVEI